MFLTFHAIEEASPGPKWQRSFERFWPSYERWFLSEGHRNRAGYMTSKRMLTTHMPELVPVYEELVELAGGGDIAARFLSLYRPPPYLAGCSQAVWTEGRPQLVRNYDYSPDLFEGVVFRTEWLRPVVATLDCVWGALDGVNDAGLVAALAFGGRRVTGDGFGIPLLIRYVLETCETTAEATAALTRLPSHMTYSVTLLDAAGDWATVYLAPDRSAVVTDARVCTNHQEAVEWPDYARMTASVERHERVSELLDLVDDPRRLVRAFLQDPLHASNYHRGFGTLYTGTFVPEDRRITFHWPNHRPMRLDLNGFEEQQRVVDLRMRTAHVASLVE